MISLLTSARSLTYPVEQAPCRFQVTHGARSAALRARSMRALARAAAACGDLATEVSMAKSESSSALRARGFGLPAAFVTLP